MMTTKFKLTERSVADLKATGADYKAFDTVLPGFHVRVLPSGVRSYAVFYRNADGKQRTVSLGRTNLLRSCPWTWCNCAVAVTALSGMAGSISVPGWTG